MASRKRSAPDVPTLIMSNGAQIDLGEPFKDSFVPADIANAIRVRCLQLEEALASNKRQKANDGAALAPVASTSSSATQKKADAKAAKEQEKVDAKAKKEADKLVKNRVKNIAKALSAAVKKADVRWQGAAKDIKVEETCTAAEFASVFDGEGTLVPSSSSSSVVTVRRLTGCDTFFSQHGVALSLRGNMYTHGRAFEKVVKTGQTDLTILGCEVKYSSGTSKLVLKFDIDPVDDDNPRQFGWFKA